MTPEVEEWETRLLERMQACTLWAEEMQPNPTCVLEKSKDLGTYRLELHDLEPAEVLGSTTVFQQSLLPSRSKLSLLLHSQASLGLDSMA